MQVQHRSAPGGGEQDEQAFDLGDGERDQPRIIRWLVIGADRGRGQGRGRVQVLWGIAAAVTAQIARAVMVSTRWRIRAV